MLWYDIADVRVRIPGLLKTLHLSVCYLSQGRPLPLHVNHLLNVLHLSKEVNFVMLLGHEAVLPPRTCSRVSRSHCLVFPLLIQLLQVVCINNLYSFRSLLRLRNSWRLQSLRQGARLHPFGLRQLGFQSRLFGLLLFLFHAVVILIVK